MFTDLSTPPADAARVHLQRRNADHGPFSIKLSMGPNKHEYIICISDDSDSLDAWIRHQSDESSPRNAAIHVWTMAQLGRSSSASIPLRLCLGRPRSLETGARFHHYDSPRKALLDMPTIEVEPDARCQRGHKASQSTLETC